MKKTLLLVAGVISLAFTHAQTQFENASFENWEGVGNPEEEPTQYSSLKTADALAWAAPQVVWRSATAHTGSYSTRIKVAAYNGFCGCTPNGIMTNGRVHAEVSAANGYVFTDPANAQWNTPCTDRPDSLVGWYQYTQQGSDIGKIEVLLHDNSAQGKLPIAAGPAPAHWVGKARKNINAGSGAWVRFSVPFGYYNNNSPDYILLVATAGDSTIPVAASELLLDDIELIYNPLLVSVTPAATQNIDIGVNGNVLTVNETPNKGVITTVTREWKFSTTAGGPYASFAVAETGTTYTPNFAAAGFYYVVCETDFGTQVVTSNEVEIVVTDPGSNTVTISPSGSQTILTSVNGNLLTASETPSAASSREWKLSMTSGSGYASFGTPETGLTYTPNFATVGTYYIICESDFSGDVQISNEVTIFVPSSAGIDENGIKFNIYNQSGLINLVFSSTENVSNFNLFDLNGRMVYTSIIDSELTQHAVNQTSGIYMYQVVSGDKIITGKIKL